MRLSAGGLIGRTVRWNGIRVATVADVLLDRDLGRAIGLEIDCEDGLSRFLPFAACELTDHSVGLLEPLALSEPETLGYYAAKGTSLAGHLDREFTDVFLDRDGDVVSVVGRAEASR